MLVAFDFDGTLSDTEMIVLLGEQAGVSADIQRITERAMNDELDFATSLRDRVALLEGLPASQASRALRAVTLRDGAGELLGDLDAAGVETAILTGGFEEGVRYALDSAGASVDTLVANRLEVEGDRLSGRVSGPLVEGTKDTALRSIVDDGDRSLAETVAIGDGANDLPMLRIAGFSIGYRPKPSVEPHCDAVVRDMSGLRALLRDRGIL